MIKDKYEESINEWLREQRLRIKNTEILIHGYQAEIKVHNDIIISLEKSKKHYVEMAKECMAQNRIDSDVLKSYKGL